LALDEGVTRDDLVAVAHHAVRTAVEHLTINTAAIASQIRAIVADMLLAAGTDPGALDQLLGVD
ncbi:hypothetical protein, partial [Nocardioides massiliensis]